MNDRNEHANDRPATERQLGYLAQLLSADRLAALSSGEAGALVGLLAGLLADRPPPGWTRKQLAFGLGLLVRLPARSAVGALLEARDRTPVEAPGAPGAPPPGQNRQAPPSAPDRDRLESSSSYGTRGPRIPAREDRGRSLPPPGRRWGRA